jgi:RNA polymerase sigma factor (sigma-70 family)
VRRRDVGADQTEFASFYRDTRDGCLRAVLATVGDRQLAEELVADAFAKAWVAWPKVRRHPAPPAWIVRTALNSGVSRWRKHRHELALADHDTAVTAPVSMDHALVAALQQLPKRQREVVALRVFLDMDTESTAEALGIAAGTVTAHLSRAVATLRLQLAPPDTESVETSGIRKG